MGESIDKPRGLEALPTHGWGDECDDERDLAIAICLLSELADSDISRRRQPVPPCVIESILDASGTDCIVDRV